MTNQITVDKLLEMRLRAMSDAFLIQMNDAKMQDLPFEDRFGMLVDAEYTTRKNNSLKRLIKDAAFDQPDAHIAAIDYTSGRKLNRALIANTVPIATPARTFSHSLPEFEPNSAGHEPNLLYNGYGTPRA